MLKGKKYSSNEKDIYGLKEVLSYTDYYPFGWEIPGRNYQSAENYRYGFQGQYAEKDEESGWNAFELRSYDARVGRWMTIDPAEQFHSPYVAFGNRPHMGVDPDGGWVFFGNISEATAVVNSLNKIYQKHYGNGNAFYVDAVVRPVLVKNPNREWYQVWKPRNIETQQVVFTVNTNENFNWNTDQYTSGVFDILNSPKGLLGDIAPAENKVPGKHFTIGQAKGFAISATYFQLSNSLLENDGTSGWNLGGTFLHETLAHYHFLGGIETAWAMQDRYGFARSSTDHEGDPLWIWSDELRNNLNTLRNFLPEESE